MLRVVWHGALFRYNTTCSIWADQYECFFNNACVRSRRTVFNKTTHPFFNVKDTFNKKNQTFNRIQRAFMFDILKSDVRLFCAVYLPIPAITTTIRIHSILWLFAYVGNTGCHWHVDVNVWYINNNNNNKNNNKTQSCVSRIEW